MNTDPSGAMFARIAGYPQAFKALIEWLRQVWDSPNAYRPGEHYMRGPGPKWREKHAQTATMVQQPLLLGEKWDS